MAVEIITSLTRQVDSSSAVLSGGKIYVYNVGTTTARDVFTDTALTVPGANPIVCDSAGLHDMRYTATGSYKIVVKTSADVTVYTRDNIDGRVPVGAGALAIANGGTGATTAAAAIAALGGSTAAEVADIAADVASLQGTLASTEKTHLATGTTAQRPGSPAAGDVRRNTTISTYEGYDGAAWVNFVVIPTGQTDPSATDTAEGLIELAVQTEMETATDVVRAVVPGRQHFHPGHPKFWVKADINGAVVVSYNVTSVTDTATGRITVTIATDFSTADWCATTTCEHAGGTFTQVDDGDQAAGTVLVEAWNTVPALLDPITWHIAGMGDQA